MKFRISLSDPHRPALSISYEFCSEDSGGIAESMARETVKFLDQADGNFMTGMRVVGVDVLPDERMAVRRFKVACLDDVHVVAASRAKEAELATMLKISMIGIPCDRLPLTPHEVAGALGKAPTARVMPEPEWASFPLADWRIREGETGDLDEFQQVPWNVRIADEAYGISVILDKGGHEHVVSVEIDMGCPAVTITPHGVSNAMVRVRSGDSEMLVEATPDEGGMPSVWRVRETVEEVADDKHVRPAYVLS